MAKQQQIQIAFDFGPPPNEEMNKQIEKFVEEIPIVVNEEPIEIAYIEPALITKSDTKIIENPATYKLQKPSTDQEIYSRVEHPIKSTSTRGRKSIKAMEAEADLINIPPDEELFTKQYYPMSVVTQMFNVNHSLLRFWENEFTVLQPRKNRKGDRLFRPEDIKNLEIIYHLLRVKKYTIEGAKDYFKNQKAVAKKFEAMQQLEQMKQFLLQIKANLS